MLDDRRVALQALFNDPDTQVQQAAAAALDAIEAVANLDHLLAQLQNGERGERIAAAFALERVNAARIYPSLLAALRSDDADLRLVVTQVLGAKKHPKTIATLIKLLDDPESGVQVEAARALGGFSDRRLPEYLAPLLKRQEQVALAALESLGALAFPEGEPALLEALQDKRRAIRCKAAEMLGRLHL